jgi:hypothetical protein
MKKYTITYMDDKKQVFYGNKIEAIDTGLIKLSDGENHFIISVASIRNIYIEDAGKG